MTPDPSTGQILPGSKFGDKLTELAREAKVIVEIGTWKGGGSTLCFADGLTSQQWLFTIEADINHYHLAYERLRNYSQVVTVWGTIVGPNEFPAYFHTLDEDRRHFYDADWKAVTSAPYCLAIIPPEIDLLLLDGGEWTSDMEFKKLRDRSKVVALDDTHEAKSIKNCRARDWMMTNGWTVLADEPDDRNGWFIGRRP